MSPLGFILRPSLSYGNAHWVGCENAEVPIVGDNKGYLSGTATPAVARNGHIDILIERLEQRDQSELDLDEKPLIDEK